MRDHQRRHQRPSEAIRQAPGAPRLQLAWALISACRRFSSEAHAAATAACGEETNGSRKRAAAPVARGFDNDAQRLQPSTGPGNAARVAPYFSFGLALRCGNRNLNHTFCTLCGIVTHLAHGSRPHATDTVARTSCRRPQPHWCHPRLFAILGSAPPRTHSLVHLGAHYGAHRGASLAAARWSCHLGAHYGASLAAARWWLISHGTTQNLPTSPDISRHLPTLIALITRGSRRRSTRLCCASEPRGSPPARAPRSPPCRTCGKRGGAPW